MNFNRMRELLLLMACEGKLVAQMEDEPKVEQIGDRASDMPFPIPEKWKWVKLSELSLDMADGPFGSNLKKEHYTSKREVRIIQLSNIGERGWRNENVKYTTFTHVETISRSKVSAGDIVIAKMMPAGRAVIVPEIENGFVLSSDAVKVVVNKERCLTRFLNFAINSPLFKHQVYSNVQGTTRIRTSLSKLKNYFIPLPPIQEQTRIVERLDVNLAEIDRAEKAYQELQKLAVVLKKKIFEKAVQGELSEQRIDDGAIDFQGKELDAFPFKIPESWRWQTFNDVLSFENGDRGPNYPAKSTLTTDPSSGQPFISAINLDTGDIKVEKLLYLSLAQKNKLRSGLIKQGDCLFCIRGSLGKFAFATEDGGAIASSLVILRPRQTGLISNKFLSCILQSPYFEECMKDRSNGTAQPNLGARELKNFPLPLPPFKEQERIALKVEYLLAQVNSLIGIEK